MASKSWLSLSEYSSKYKVSVSTLRRRIKGQEVEYSFEDGKYLLLDQGLDSHQVMTKKAPPKPTGQSAEQAPRPPRSEQVEQAPDQGGASSKENNAVQTLLAELKKAYSIILQEKEEQIFQLKDEVADLRTLVRVLEEENDRLRNKMKDSHSLDEWLKSVD